MTRVFLNHVNQILKSSKRILLVEHDSIKQHDLVNFLQQQNHEVVVAKNGLRASEKINSETFDLFIIEKSLPYDDAMTLYRSIINKNLNIPVIFITDEKELCEVVTIEYKKFKENFISTLKEVIENTLRSKSKDLEMKKELYRIGSFTLDFKSRLLFYKDDEPLKLTPKESKLLKLLITHNDKLVDKKYLQKKIWHTDGEKLSYSSMNVYISRLRKLLKKDKSVSITNVYKTGFKLSG